MISGAHSLSFGFRFEERSFENLEGLWRQMVFANRFLLLASGLRRSELKAEPLGVRRNRCNPINMLRHALSPLFYLCSLTYINRIAMLPTPRTAHVVHSRDTASPNRRVF